MQTMNQSRPWKYMLAGTLAGASGAIGLMIAVTLGLGVGLIWQYAYFRNIVVLNDRATTTMLEDVDRIPKFLWVRAGFWWLWRSAAFRWREWNVLRNAIHRRGAIGSPRTLCSRSLAR